MNTHDEHNDQRLDHNLRTVGRAVRLPSAGRLQQERWRSAANESMATQPAVAPQTHGPLHVLHPRRWLAVFGSAAAAAALIGAFLYLPGGDRRVEAAMIWRNLRDTLHRGFRVEMSHIRAEKFQVDGRIDLLFPQPIKLAEMLDDQESQSPSEIYCEVTLKADPDAEDVGGLQMSATGVLSDDQKWIFARVDQFPQRLAEDEPLVNLFVPALQRGVLLDIADLDLDSSTSTTSPAAADSDPADANIGLNLALGGVSASNPPAEAGKPASAEAPSFGGYLDFNPDHMLRQLLNGTLKREDLTQLAAQMDSLARDVRVEQATDGAWVLVAQQFNLPADDPEAVALLQNAALRVEYVEGEGVRLAELLHVGEQDGLIRFSFIDAPSTPTPQRAQLETDGVTVIDRNFLKLFDWGKED